MQFLYGYYTLHDKIETQFTLNRQGNPFDGYILFDVCYGLALTSQYMRLVVVSFVLSGILVVILPEVLYLLVVIIWGISTTRSLDKQILGS